MGLHLHALPAAAASCRISRSAALTPLIVAQVSITLFGDNDILPILGIDYYPFTHVQIYPFGSIAAVFYGIIIGYSVLQYQLLDFQIAMGRIAARFVRIALPLPGRHGGHALPHR